MSEPPAPGGSPVHVMYGTRWRIVDEIGWTSVGLPVAWLADDAGDRHAWQGVRRLTAHASAALAPAAFADIVARHRPVLAALYPDRAIELGPEEAACRRALCADLRTHYTHSAVSWQPLIEAAAALIADLFAACGAVVAVPELANLDAQTGHVLLEAFRAHRTRLAGLRIGHDPDRDREPRQVWGVRAEWSLEQARAQLCDYQLCPDCEVSWLQGHGRPQEVPAIPANAWSASTPDRDALAVLGAAGPLPHSELVRCVAAMRWSAETYAFGQAFRIGVLLEPYRELLDRDHQAEHAALTAIAATNAHFVDRPTPGFDDRLYAMYERALALCADPAERASLSVGLAFAAVERGAPRAAVYLEQAAARVGRTDEDIEDEIAATHDRAWLAVACALDRLHHGDHGAVELHVRAACAAFTRWAGLTAAVSSGLRAVRARREAACGRFLLLSHCAIHAGVMTSPGARWFEQARQEQPDIPAVVLFEVYHWVLLPQGNDDLPLVAERCRAGIHDAERCWDVRPWYVYRSVAAECAYRTGRAGEASEHCGRLLAMIAPGNPQAALVPEVRTLAVRAFLRVGRHAAAAELAQARLAESAAADRAEVRALRGLALGAQGDRAGALAALDQAIDDAVARGERGGMLRVANRAVELMYMLDDREEAGRALDSAWDLAEDEPGQFSSAVSPPDCLRLCVLHARQLEVSGPILARAFSVLPACMNDADSWWDVTELLDQAIGWCDAGGSLPPEAETGLSAVRRLTRSRTEWAGRVRRLDASESY